MILTELLFAGVPRQRYFSQTVYVQQHHRFFTLSRYLAVRVQRFPLQSARIRTDSLKGLLCAVGYSKH